MKAAFGLGWRASWSRAGCLVLITCIVLGALASTLATIVVGLPRAFAAAAVRESDRYPVGPGDDAMHPVVGPPLLGAQRDTVWHGNHIAIVQVVWRRAATPPPGLSALPRPGHSAVSPALSDLLDDPHAGAGLATRIPGVEATIGDTGLADPGEYFAYVGIARPPAASMGIEIAGWGLRGRKLFHPQLSSYLAVPLLALTVLPLAALVSMLLRLDTRRRRVRASLLHVLGGNRLHCVAVDAGALMPGVLAGCIVAVALQPLTRSAYVRWALGDRIAFPADLDAGFSSWAMAAIVLVLTVLGSSFVSHDPDLLTARLAGEVRYRLRLRLCVSLAALTIGTFALVLILRSPVNSDLRSTASITTTAGLVLAGATVGLPPLVVVLSRHAAQGRVAGELARGRLLSSLAGWRSPAMTLLLCGVLAGTSLAVLTVLDAADQTDAVIWDPGTFPAKLALVSATPAALADVVPEYSRHVYPVIPIGQASVQATAETPARAAFVPCSALSYFVAVPAGVPQPCEVAWALDARLAGGPATRFVVAGRTVALGVRVARARAPVEVVGGTETLLIPATDRRMSAALVRSAAPVVRALVRIDSDSDVEALRDALWDDPGIAFSGGTATLSTVVSRGDLLIDAQSYLRTYWRVVIGGLITMSILALAAVGLSGALEVTEAQRRDAILVSLGASAATLRQTLALTCTVPALVATVLGWFVGVVFGISYLALSSYEQLDGFLGGFPLGRYALFGAVELGLVTGVAATGLLAVGRHAQGTSAGGGRTP